jgi:2'-5' RNA ligase
MRLFVAIELCDDVRRIARETADALQQRLGSRINARWISPENLHVTVRFIGHVADETAPRLIQAITAPLRVSPFDIRAGQCGLFPRSGPPRVIWIGLSDGLQGCAAIHEEMNARLAPFGFAPEERPFSAHLTLARVKETPRGAARDVRQIVSGLEPMKGRCRVTQATLFQSRLSPSGARYESLARIDLAG